ncbi:50S ribosomal protein L11 methyltransferase [Geosporobacter ferrireducens]|uniref:Ribosomal protein L11 methyltransferase n=1 Tax=Geosporobacter ferrireducens TaxID=1424294 RepID=A0A1D8GC97_9FIRM|nr:50S ribosomal protein L11 methyltransferase [Geosporobacter ferrireducens]AOT68531.1 ribosomal protein L11 methyltransferase [Geosporobacter ferrireducens]MTI53996.1 50S ribosomal protein L11 methyltransferase [Geosporobacter ferrireducens]
MKWIEVKIKTTTEAIEAVSNILYDVGVGGVVIEDPNDPIFKEKDAGDWDYVDESLLQNVLEGAIVKGYLPESEDLIDKIEWIRQSVEMIPQYNLDKGLGEVTTTEVYEEDWANAWKKYYKPKKIGGKIVVKPTWESYTPQEEEIIVELDPGMAFGTGTHETTMMCVQNLEKYVTADSLVFDIGCGSGILSIVAAKLGAKKVVGIDLDEVAVKVSKKNVEDNHVVGQVEIKRGNLLDTLHEQADIVVANIIADIIVILAEDIRKFLKRDSIFIASGIILDKIDEVTAALNKNRLEILQIETLGEWAAIVSKPEGDQKNE